ncbi:MAG: DNA repair helicase XPB [Myxococcota bacterium]
MARAKDRGTTDASRNDLQRPAPRGYGLGMAYVPENPLIVQGDHSLLLETQNPHHEAARDDLLAFAELVKSPEYIHTWRLTALSLWNAAAAGHTADEVLERLTRWAKYPIPENIPVVIQEHMSRYGTLRLVSDGPTLRLEVDHPSDLQELLAIKAIADLIGKPVDDCAVKVHPRHRGELKQVLTHLGHPVQDLAGYTDGDALEMALRTETPQGEPFQLRDYQIEAIDAFSQGPGAGSGVIVLPCGAGKTLVGIGAMIRTGMRTLILCTGQTALRQWKREILRSTTLTEDQVGEYTSEVKQLRPVTLTTYQILTWRPDQHSAPAHFPLFHRENWGLIVYDEVHLLPAPIFRETAMLQARRRLGLTATLVREDHRETDVFALVGPKRFDLPWKILEHQGWIAQARCVEVRVPLSDPDRLRYVGASARARFKIAATNPRKTAIVDDLIERHEGRPTLVLGTYVDQLQWIARRFNLPIITGKTPKRQRNTLYGQFRNGETNVLVLSKVGNFAVDLPSASVAIQVSGTFGSRQEEAQRLGRVLRPKKGENQATFYTLVTSDTSEQEHAERRQLFLAEQGYPYRIEVVA